MSDAVAIAVTTVGRDGRGVIELTAAPTIDDGLVGDYGIQYVSGEVALIYGPKTAEGWPAGRSLRGRGVYAVGASAPSNGFANNGDFAIGYDDDNEAIILYGPKASGTWPAGKSMRGPTRAPSSIVDITENTTIGDTHLGKALVVNSASTVTLTFPSTIARGWSMLIRRMGAGAVILAAGSGATITFQYSGDDRVAKQNGTVSIDNINAATAWVVSEGTAAA